MTVVPLRWPDKDPDEVLDFRIDWSDWLAGDTISSATWTVPAGLTKDSEARDDSSTTVGLSGGADETDYRIVCVITTAAGRTFVSVVMIEVRAR